MPKVAVIGSGNVGAAAGMWIAGFGIADVALIDKNEGLAKGKAMDISDSLYILGSNKKVAGGGFDLAQGSDIVVITAGMARKPGMTREDLLIVNGQIVKSVLNSLPGDLNDPVFICVTNPLDIMTTLIHKIMNIPENRLVGMGVNLDTSRMANIASEESDMARIAFSPMVLGAHGKEMLPLEDSLTVKGMDILSNEQKKNIARRTSKRGAEIVEAFGSGSAYVAPGAAIYQIVKAIILDEGAILPLSVVTRRLGIENAGAIGLPVKVGRNGCFAVNIDNLPGEVLEKIKKISVEIAEMADKLISDI